MLNNANYMNIKTVSGKWSLEIRPLFGISSQLASGHKFLKRDIDRFSGPEETIHFIP
jgi:hypothetical protein